DTFSRTALAGLLAWLFIGVAAAHPDYLPWFNAMAGPDPAYIAFDSNFDWGQDTLRLAREMRKRHIERIHILYAGTAWLGNLGIQADGMDPYVQYRGWIAVSETALRLNRHGEYDWLKLYQPVTRVGYSIRLYYIPPS